MVSALVKRFSVSRRQDCFIYRYNFALTSLLPGINILDLFNCNGYKLTEHIRSRKCHFLRQLLLIKLNPVIMVTTCTGLTRPRKCQFLRGLLLLQLTPIVMVTKCSEHIRSRTCHFLRRLLLL